MFVGLGSTFRAVTTAVLVRTPTDGGVPAKVMEAIPLLVRIPRSQMICPPILVHVPCDGVVTNVMPAGGTSVTVTAVASAGPLFVMVTV